MNRKLNCTDRHTIKRATMFDGDYDADHYAEGRKLLLNEARRKYPTIYLAVDYVTGGTYPTTWASAYVVTPNGEVRKLWRAERMRRRRSDGNLYWHHNGWGTQHSFVIAETIGDAFGIRDAGNFFTVRYL